MKRNSKMSLALHALGHLGVEPNRRFTSEELAAQNQTNPVFVRRVLGTLRSAGLVTSEKGRSGGWRLGRPATEITVADVYLALGMSSISPEVGEENPPDCKIEAALHGVMDRAMQKAETVLVDELAIVRISDLSNSLGRS